MIKVLYIDTESFPAHLNFNSIHIKALIDAGAVVEGVFREGYSEKLNLPIKTAYCISHSLYGKRNNSMSARLDMFKRLLAVKKNVEFNSYDKIILAYYDELVLPFAGFPHGLYLINHINIGALNHWLKIFLFKRLSRRNTQIVLTKGARQFVLEIGVKQCIYIPHGLPIPYSKECCKPLWIKHRYFIFSPSATSSDFRCINSIVHNNQFINYLQKNDILFIIRGAVSNVSSSNIKVIDNYMDTDEYQGCFIHSNAIFIAYKEDRYKYRASAIMLEAISNNKRIVARYSEGLSEYSYIIGDNSFFNSIDDLINRLDRIIKKTKTIKYSNVEEPNYHNILFR